jgi:DNA-binding MarR family transcriptional regulator
MAEKTEQEPLTQDEEAAFRALARLTIVLPRVLDSDLVREQHISLSEYLALMHLSETSDRKMRMSDLAAGCNLSLSGMTRIVTRLESEGFVERVKCPQDARGSNAVLTDLGFARLEEAYPTHLASVRRHIVDHLKDTDLTELSRVLGAVAT